MTTFRKSLLIGVTALSLGAGSFAAYAASDATGGDVPSSGATSGGAASGEQRAGGEHHMAGEHHGGKHHMGGRPMSAEDRAKFQERMKERMAKREAELRDKLKLTAAQEPAWKTFTEKMKPGNPPARPDRAEMEKLTAPERMEKALAMMKEREKRMTERVAAVKEFYVVLTPEQQKVFDAEFAKRPHHHRRS